MPTVEKKTRSHSGIFTNRQDTTFERHQRVAGECAVECPATPERILRTFLKLLTKLAENFGI